MKLSLGTEECVNQLLKDLFINLRKKVNRWSKLTGQTSQAKMGYIGQHLVSAVTGFKGGKSGARGKDLILSNGQYAEIKTCTKVDQLGKCKDCGEPVSFFETRCPKCGSINVLKKDDSKWLINIKKETSPENGPQDSEDVLTNILKPTYYFFVLFEFEDIEDVKSPIVVTIYRVNPNQNGFVLCMLDYFYNLKHKTAFNMWPHMLKFDLCNPQIIYRSKIKSNDSIETIVFKPHEPEETPFTLHKYIRSNNFKKYCHNVLAEYGIELSDNYTTTEILDKIEQFNETHNLSHSERRTMFAKGFYRERIELLKSELEQKGKTVPSIFDEFVNSGDR